MECPVLLLLLLALRSSPPLVQDAHDYARGTHIACSPGCICGTTGCSPVIPPLNFMHTTGTSTSRLILLRAATSACCASASHSPLPALCQTWILWWLWCPCSLTWCVVVFFCCVLAVHGCVLFGGRHLIALWLRPVNLGCWLPRHPGFTCSLSSDGVATVTHEAMPFGVCVQLGTLRRISAATFFYLFLF